MVECIGINLCQASPDGEWTLQSYTKYIPVSTKHIYNMYTTLGQHRINGIQICCVYWDSVVYDSVVLHKYYF